MNLTQLTKQPELIKVSIDDEETIKEFGEAIEFYCYDRQPLTSFLKMADNKERGLTGMFDIMKDMILDAEGNKVLSDTQTLPGGVLIKVVGKMVDILGK